MCRLNGSMQVAHGVMCDCVSVRPTTVLDISADQPPKCVSSDILSARAPVHPQTMLVLILDFVKTAQLCGLRRGVVTSLKLRYFGGGID